MKGYVFDYVNENEFKKLERALKKYNMLAYKKLFFEYYPKLKDGEFSLDDYMEFFDLEEISFFANFNWLIDYDTYKNFSETELEIAISKVQKIINELEMKNVNNEFSIEIEKYKYMLEDINSIKKEKNKSI